MTRTLLNLTVLALLLTLASAEEGKSIWNTVFANDTEDEPSQILEDFGEHLNPELENEHDEPFGNDTVNRTKKALTPDKYTKRVSLLFEKENGEIENVTELNATEFIIRLQEKYEYRMCETYRESIPDVHNKYFQHDNYLTEPEEGDEIYQEEKKDKATKTVNHRYKMYGEGCDPVAERQFWLEMFQIAENDTEIYRKETIHAVADRPVIVPGRSTTTTAPPPTKPSTQADSTQTARTTKLTTTGSPRSTTTRPSTAKPVFNPHDYVHLQYEAAHLMSKWNGVWIDFRTKHVCNQKLLLECLPKDETYDAMSARYGFPDDSTSTSTGPDENFECKCRRNGIGLPTVVSMLNIDSKRPRIPRNYFTTQYYYDRITYINDKENRTFGEYKHKLGCVVQANLPNSSLDIPFTNPCDFFLPMIGICQANCVENASCASVSKEEKDEVRKRALESEEVRVRSGLHDSYHNKCVCKDGTHCRKVTVEELNSSVRLTPLSLIVTVSCLPIFLFLENRLDS